MSKERKNIFISHRGTDEKHIKDFKDYIGKKIDIYDSSIVESEPNKAKNSEYIKYEILAPKIDWAGTVVVMIGADTKNSEYVTWEIEYANRKGKHIVGVYLPGFDEKDIPEALKKYGDTVVSWNRQKIIDAINGGNEWDDASGNALPNVITGIVC